MLGEENNLSFQISAIETSGSAFYLDLQFM